MRRATGAGVLAAAVVVTLALSSCSAPEPYNTRTLDRKGPGHVLELAPPSAAPEEPDAAAAPKPATAPADACSAPAGPHSIDDPNSIWVISNKRRPLNPSSYAPSDLRMPNARNANGQPLRALTACAVEQMIAGAAAAGISLSISSAYRSYDLQVQTYNGFVNNYGQAHADTTSARPGHSEHQTGLAVDLDDGTGCNLSPCFADKPGGQWLATNAANYGFVMRYPNGLQGITGFNFEPWHYRYVGPELAMKVKNSGAQTLEQYFGLPAAPDYAG